MSAWTLTVAEGIGELCFNQPDADVNILTSENLKAFDHAVGTLASRNDIKALLVTSGKSRIFIAGADIREIEAITETQDAFDKAQMGKAVFKKLEQLPFPTVCVINGACLGGGTELALSCRYRTASFSPNVKIGLPEVNLGILPGFGGSIRLPRLIGLIKALPMLLTGKILSADEAFKLGVVDRLFFEKTLREESVQFAKAILAGEKGRRPVKQTLLEKILENTPFGRVFVLNQARKEVLAKTKGKYPAPLKIIELVKKTYGRKGDGAYREESLRFSELGTTKVSKNLIKVFYLSEKFKKIRWTSAGEQPGVRKVGVVGAGVMGGAIAQSVSNRNIPVRVKDINDKALAGALKEAIGIYQGAVRRRRLKPNELENKMDLISVGLTLDGFKNADIIIEAVVEDLGIKQKVFRELADLTGPETILASNTSSLPVSRMADGCRNPERITGLHFFNPVDRMPLVEVIRAEKSSDAAIERTIAFARGLGKTAIVTADRPGFLVNRLLLPYMNEAAYLLESGWSPQDIDRAAVGFGMPMGPVELIDQVGIDVGYKVAHILEEAFGERMKVAPVLQRAKEKGLLGKKGGKGFYIYGKKHGAANPELHTSGRAKKCSPEDALKRMLYVMINEAARCLEEKVIDGPETVDIGMIMGTGFPPFRGGLLRYADSIGTGGILKDLERFQKEVDAKRFEPAPLLRRLAADEADFHAKA